MEKLAQSISHTIGGNLSLDEEKQKVIAYGLAAMFQMLILFVTITIIGVIGGFYPEALVLFFGVGLLRRSSGGNHAPTFNSCLLISIGSINLMAVLSHYISNGRNTVFLAIFTLLSYSLTFFLIYKYAPVDTPNKPIVNPLKIKRLRKDAVLTVILYFSISVVLIFLGLKRPTLLRMGVSLTMASLWQAMTLTELSKGFFNFLHMI